MPHTYEKILKAVSEALGPKFDTAQAIKIAKKLYLDKIKQSNKIKSCPFCNGRARKVGKEPGLRLEIYHKPTCILAGWCADPQYFISDMQYHGNVEKWNHRVQYHPGKRYFHNIAQNRRFTVNQHGSIEWIEKAKKHL